MLNINQKIFAQNLLLTQAYCELQLANADKSPAEMLRSFNPEYNDHNVFSFKQGEYDKNVMSYLEVVWSVDPWMDETKLIYQELFDQQLANKVRVSKFNKIDANFEGKILVAEVDWTIIDGCSESVSEGLIDIFDCPPIDTWFYLTENEDSRLLFCWIPDIFVEILDIAVVVNATDCLRWIDNL